MKERDEDGKGETKKHSNCKKTIKSIEAKTKLKFGKTVNAQNGQVTFGKRKKTILHKVAVKPN